MSITLHLQLPGYITTTQEKILDILHAFSYKKSYAYLGYKNLAKRCKRSVSTIKRLIKQLKDLGFIFVKKMCRRNSHITLNYDVLMQYHPDYDVRQEQDFHNIPDEKIINSQQNLSTISVDNVLSNDENMDVQKVDEVSSVVPHIYNNKCIELYNNISNTLNINDTGDNNMTDLNNKTFEQITETPVQNHTLTVKNATPNKKQFDEMREKLKVQVRGSRIRAYIQNKDQLFNETAPNQYIPTDEKLKPYHESIIEELLPIKKEDIHMRKQNENPKPCYEHNHKFEKNIYGEDQDDVKDFDFDDLVLDYDDE